ncbi:hypothetical protein K9M58_04465 [Candidatus Gracilibacteria bacterium]|nr:hypothetical protein [Candidatus Gracilibacteria bacterium]
MRKLFLGLFLFLPFTSVVLAREVLRTQDSIHVGNGAVEETGVLADSDGNVFLEFRKGTRIVNASDRTSFVGEILPPTLIPLPSRPPRARIQEILTFELLADTANKMLFTDKFNLMRNQTILRMQLTDPDNFQRTSIVRVIIPLSEEYGHLALWEYKGDNQWSRLGGILEDSVDPDTKIFTSAIRSTGIFSLLDEDPSPTFIPPFPIDQIEMAPESSLPPVGQENNQIQFNEAGYVQDNLFAPENNPPAPNSEIPAVGVEGEEQEVPAVSPLPSNLPPLTDTESTNDTPPPSPPEVNIPPDAELPQSGPLDEQSSNASFPFGILFAFMILGASAFLAFRKKRYSGVDFSSFVWYNIRNFFLPHMKTLHRFLVTSTHNIWAEVAIVTFIALVSITLGYLSREFALDLQAHFFISFAGTEWGLF